METINAPMLCHHGLTEKQLVSKQPHYGYNVDSKEGREKLVALWSSQVVNAMSDVMAKTRVGNKYYSELQIEKITALFVAMACPSCLDGYMLNDAREDSEVLSILDQDVKSLVTAIRILWHQDYSNYEW